MRQIGIGGSATVCTDPNTPCARVLFLTIHWWVETRLLGAHQVWEARCKPLDAMVAVKLVNLEKLQEKSLNTLIQEAHTMAGLNHENVLPLHCSFIAGEDLWLVMPYVAGGNLSELLRSQVTSLTHVLSA